MESDVLLGVTDATSTRIDLLGALGPTGPGRNDVLDAQEIEKLKALGYL